MSRNLNPAKLAETARGRTYSLFIFVDDLQMTIDQILGGADIHPQEMVDNGNNAIHLLGLMADDIKVAVARTAQAYANTAKNPSHK